MAVLVRGRMFTAELSPSGSEFKSLNQSFWVFTKAPGQWGGVGVHSVTNVKLRTTLNIMLLNNV